MVPKETIAQSADVQLFVVGLSAQIRGAHAEPGVRRQGMWDS